MVLVDRNICELIEFDDIAEVNGRKVLGGLMGVAKAGNDRNTGPQRLIMNIKVSNWAATSHEWSVVVFGSGGRRNSGLVRGGPQVLFLCVRDPETLAKMDDLCITREP